MVFKIKKYLDLSTSTFTYPAWVLAVVGVILNHTASEAFTALDMSGHDEGRGDAGSEVAPAVMAAF
jgi:hypothetical protein